VVYQAAGAGPGKNGKAEDRAALQEGNMQPVFLIDALDRVEQLSLIKPSLIPGW